MSIAGTASPFDRDQWHPTTAGLENVARGKPSRQSSTTLFRSSKPGGAGATSGLKTGGVGFQTRFEWAPWWIVDLLQIHNVTEVVVYNREDSAADRAASLSVCSAIDPAGPWVEIRRCYETFGGYLTDSPLRITLASPIPARYIRLHLNTQNTLHLDEVEVYGVLADRPAGSASDLAYRSQSVVTGLPAANDGVRAWDEIWTVTRNLESLGSRYGLNVEDILLRPTFHLDRDTDFDGSIDTLRVEAAGLWGNVFYAYFNACMIAQAMGCKAIELHTVHFEPPDLPIVVDGIRIGLVDKQASAGKTLALNCYWPRGFESVLEPYSAEFALDTIERYLRPIFSKYIAASGSLGARTIVLHFRSGEIFAPGGTNAWYVQPPASYYIRALEYARENLGVTAAHVVYQDKSNPALDVVLNHLSSSGIAFSVQSSTTFRDLTTIMSAHHIVSGYGTFCEAIALLSNRLESYFSFRRISSQRLLAFWAQHRLGELLNAKGIRTFVIDDPDDSYIKRESWTNSSEQIDLMSHYPIRKLRLMEYSGDERVRAG
jgi:hypothetical protein